MGIYAADIETTGLLHQMKKQASPRLHNFCAIPIDSDEIVLFEHTNPQGIQGFLDEGHTLIMHYGKLFDFEALEFLGFDTSGSKLIDSVALSWYLEPNRIVHGLEKYGEEFGVPKPVIDDWESQTQEDYNHRVIEDCKIQKRLWLRQVSRLQELYGKEEGSYKRIVDFLMWKMDEQVMQQRNKWKLDVEGAEKLQAELQIEVEKKTDALRLAMPKNPKYVVRSRPAKPFTKSGELSATGLRWKELTESLGIPFEHKEDIKVVKEYEDGNPASHTQIKSWLDSLGWVAETFKFVREDDGTTRQIPQVNLKGGEVCQSVKDLIPKCAGIEHIAGLGILNHRNSMVKGFLRDHIDGYLEAGCQGFTNTLRLQHSTLVNLPSLRVAYGEQIRGLLVARNGCSLLGSDLSSLEDRLKHHFQWKLDPEYVKSQMEDGFDPHMTVAVMGGLMTQEEMAWYKMYKKLPKEEHTEEGDKEFRRLDDIRGMGKSTNYAAQYGAGIKTIARTAKVSEKVGKKLHEGYHKLNWSIEKIAKMTTVKKTSFGDWQLNPINKFWYSLRSEKDRFSTLIQGTGAYVLDLWLWHCSKLAKKRGLEFKLLGQFHDELINEQVVEQEQEFEKLIADGLEEVNKQLKLNRELACDINFGKKYSDIH